MLLKKIMNNTSQYVDKGVDFLSSTTGKVADSIRGWIESYIPSVWLVNIIILFFGVAIFFIATKITNKVAKFVLYVLGIIIVIGLGFLIFS